MLTPLLELLALYPRIVLAGFSTFLVSVLLMQSSIRVFNFKRPTIPAVFFLTYNLMIFFPAFLVYHDYPGPHRDAYILGVISVMVTVPLGIIFANSLFDFKYRETERYFTSPPQEPASSRGMFLTHLMLGGVLVLIFIDYLFHTPRLPIIEMIMKTSDPMGLTLAREESFKLLDPRWGGPNSTPMFYAYLFLRTLLFPVVIMTTLGYALLTKRLNWALLFLVVFLVGSFYAISSLARAPVSAIFMRVFFFLCLFYQCKISKKLMACFLVLMLMFPLLVTTFANSNTRSLIDGLRAVGVRLTYAPALDLYYYFEIFPSAHDFLYGHTLAKPILQLVGAKYFYIENFVARYISPYGVPSAHANAAFISNLHADFGFPGIAIGSFTCGVLMQTLHIMLARSTKTILNMAVYSFMIYAIWVLNFGSVTSVLLVNGTLPVLALVGLMRFTSHLMGTVLKPAATRAF